MTYVIEEGADLAHAGVKGMKWGVRKDRATGGPRGSASKSAPAKPRPTLTSEQRLKIGKQVTIAVVAAAGGIGIGALGGPIAGTAAGAAIRGILGELSNSKELGAIERDANRITEEIKADPFYNYSGPKDLVKIAANSDN